jgi:hypothetical protein
VNANYCLFCLWETDFNLAPGESTTCPICGVDVFAFSSLLNTEHFWSQIKERIPSIEHEKQNWETRIMVDENHFQVFVWNGEEGLPTSQVAEILGHSDVRAVSYLVRNGFLPNTKSIQKGEKSVRYFVPRKDIVDHMNRKSKAQKQPLE